MCTPTFVWCFCKELNIPRRHFLATTTKQDVDGEILKWNYAFSATLEYANCSLDAIVLASCEGDLMVVLGRCLQTSVLSLAGSLPINDRQTLSKTDIC